MEKDKTQTDDYADYYGGLTRVGLSEERKAQMKNESKRLL